MSPAQTVTDAAEAASAANEVVPGVTQTARGDYRWTYRLNLLTNPVVALTLVKVLGLALLGVAAFLFLLTLGDGFAAAGTLFLQILGYGALLSLALTAVGLLLTSLILGGTYDVRFDMDEKGVSHTQLPRQFRRARAAAYATALLGALAGRPSVAGAGLLAGQKQMSRSVFSRVRKIRALPSLHAILLSGGMERNQVYAAPEQYAFVLDYIVSHCPRAKKK